MPKKKKTRKQKIISDKRHKDYSAFTPPPQANPSTTSSPDRLGVQSVQTERSQTIHKPQHISGQLITTAHYSYLYSDLRKTFFLTCSIIIAELLLGYIFFGAQ